MSDICEEAGVSRGTLYRYFKSKDDVLDAIGSHVRSSVDSVLQAAVAAHPDPNDRLRVVLQAMLDYRDQFPQTAVIVRTEPGFALDFFARSMPELVDAAARALEPVLDEAPPVRDGLLSRTELAEIFERLILTAYLLPTRDVGQLPRRVAAAWASFVPRETAASVAAGS
jgi:AcrR family transcriptional regulator